MQDEGCGDSEHAPPATERPRSIAANGQARGLSERCHFAFRCWHSDRVDSPLVAASRVAYTPRNRGSVFSGV